MIIHNLKVAMRNLMKYKLQVTISVLSIAVGIVTLALVHAFVSNVRFPSICSQPYYERSYSLWIEDQGEKEVIDSEHGGFIVQASFSLDMVRALKRDGGPKAAERIVVQNTMRHSDNLEFLLCDSTKRKFETMFVHIDPELTSFMGLRSAVTGQPIKKLQPGEAIISHSKATSMFGKANPVGAVTFDVFDTHPMPIKIVDVFEDVSLMERWISNANLLTSLGDIEEAWNAQTNRQYYARFLNVVLKKGCTKDQLLAELNERLKPFNQTVHLSEVSSDIDTEVIINTQLFFHLAGSLILLAAIIGFLRMQMQLFWMRKREVSLRMVNGAKRGQLFLLFFTEVFLVVALAVAASVMMGVWVEDFIYTRFTEWMYEEETNIRGFAFYALYIGGGLLLICALVIWLTLTRICRSGQGLAANMRRSRTHLFRNVMLGIQILICLVFVCATLLIADWGGKMMEKYHLPSDLTPYKESILLNLQPASWGAEAIKKELEKLPSLEKMVPHVVLPTAIDDIEHNEEAQAAFVQMRLPPMFYATDTSLVEFFQAKVNWFREPTNTGEFILLGEDVYNKLRELGIECDNTMTIHSYRDLTIPVAGTISNIPYVKEYTSILVHPVLTEIHRQFVLVPRKGKYKALVYEVDSLIRRMEPSIVVPMAQNFHESHTEVAMIETARDTGRILALVSLLICAMSIYSTIALDTRSRQKEVAIRKVNGAKSRDIYRLFGRLYLVLVVIAMVFALPAVVGLKEFLVYDEFFPEQVNETKMLPIQVFALGSLIVITMIAAIVTWNIRSIMRTNPSEIIAKE